MAKVGLILSGCGVKDGSEIHEAVLSAYFLDKAGAQIVFMAPDVQQEVVNHITGQAESGKRNVLVESARIARGNIRNIKDVNANELDAVVFPGGFGAVKNLCNFATEGAAAKTHPDVSRLLQQMHRAKKPIGAVCISPAVVAAVFKETPAKPILTIGTDKNTAATLEKMNARHENHPVDEIAIDRENRIVSTPAYMLGARISEVAVGIEKLVNEVLKFAKTPVATSRG